MQRIAELRNENERQSFVQSCRVGLLFVEIKIQFQTGPNASGEYKLCIIMLGAYSRINKICLCLQVRMNAFRII